MIMYRNSSAYSLLFTCLFTILCIPFLVTAVPPMGQIPGMPPMSEEEMQAMMEIFQKLEDEYNRLSPEEKKEIDNQAREILIKEGYDPDTLEPLNPQQQIPAFPTKSPLPTSATPTPPTTPTAPTEIPTDCSLVVTHSPQQASCLLNSLITLLETVRLKLSLMRMDTTTLAQWIDVLRLDIKTINKPEHISRLTSETFNRLYELLVELQEILFQEEGQLLVTDINLDPARDPYIILGVPYSAQQDEIESRYAELRAEYDPIELEKTLREAGVSDEKIERRLRSAKIKTASIQEAYEQLSNVNLRRQVDRARTIAQEQQQEIDTTSQKAVERIYDTIEQLINRGLIQEIEQFMARYEPTALAHKKQMETAEQQRLSEQTAYNVARTANLPQPSPGGGYNDFFGGFPNFGGNSGLPGLGSSSSTSPWASPTPSKSLEAGSGEKPGATEKGKDKTSGKKDEKKADAKDKAKKDEGKKKKDEQKRKLDAELKNALAELSTHLTSFETSLENPVKQGQLQQVKRAITASKPETSVPQNITTFIQDALKSKLIESFKKVNKLAGDIAKGSAEMLQKCQTLWHEHMKKHKKSYDVLKALIMYTEPFKKQANETGKPLAAELLPVQQATELLVGILKVLGEPTGEEEPVTEEEKKNAAESKSKSGSSKPTSSGPKGTKAPGEKSEPDIKTPVTDQIVAFGEAYDDLEKLLSSITLDEEDKKRIERLEKSIKESKPDDFGIMDYAQLHYKIRYNRLHGKIEKLRSVNDRFDEKDETYSMALKYSNELLEKYKPILNAYLNLQKISLSDEDKKKIDELNEKLEKEAEEETSE